MNTYLYELPTTGAISFADFCVDDSDDKPYISYLSDATQTRANLRGALKESKRTEDAEKDYLNLVKIIDEYLPHLRAILSCIESSEIRIKSDPVFSWRTTLINNLFNNSPRLPVPSLQAEYAFTLLTYAFCLSNLSRSTVTSLGSYETDRGISDSERKVKDEKLNFAATLLCRASGTFSYVSETVLPQWIKENGPIMQKRPPELNREVTSALAKLSLADAQSLAIRKLLSRSAYDNVVSPGPPLPSSHPSPGLLAKLHLECASLYTSAHTLVKTPSSSNSKSKEGSDGGVSTSLRRYLSDEGTYHHTLARKWLGVDAGENKNGSKPGEAIAFLLWAKKGLEELATGKISGALREERRERSKTKVSVELENVQRSLAYYRKMNDSMSFQPVPPQTNLPALVPAGRLAIAAKPFAPPTPAFGPGSVEYTQRQMERSSLQDSLHGDGPVGDTDYTLEIQSPSSGSDAKAGGTYLGAGSYF